MGRGGSNRGEYPQLARVDTGRSPDRDVRLARRPEGFAVRRYLDQESQIAVSGIMDHLQSRARISEIFDFRDPENLQITMVAQGVTASQMSNRPQDRDKLNVAGFLREEGFIPGSDKEMYVDLSELHAFDGEILVAKVMDGPLQVEVGDVHEFIKEEGNFRATPGYPIPQIPHLTLGRKKRGYKKLEQSERLWLDEATKDIFPIQVKLQPMEVYPPVS